MFPSALRCISLVQPAHIPSCCPFQNMAGEGKEERERGSQSTRLMPVDHTSSKREARQAWPHLVESAQNAWGPGNVEVEETGANSQAFFPPPPSRAAGPWPSHTSIFSFIVHAVAGVPLQFQPSGGCPLCTSVGAMGHVVPPFVLRWTSDQWMLEPRLTQASYLRSSHLSLPVK